MSSVATENKTDSHNFLQQLLAEQHELTAVERFSQQHANAQIPAGRKYYQDLIPLTQPQPGQQYAFEVDLDACSGCKACVSACHSLNGLDEDELWRNVGQLVGGSTDLPIVQHVTTACHHCIEPACMQGCPVEAYEKDELTGIVRHLDDQCIGCQYCVLKCPYDVPVYSPSKGIVRKCDMCHQRLEVGEAPACVQSCPNQAIRIRLVDQQAVIEESETNQFLPAAPEPGYTIPTTTYKTSEPLPRNALPADYFAVHRAHGHLPLVFMLVLTQMSVGAFVIEQLIFSYFAMFRTDVAATVRPLHLCAALVLGFMGLTASIFHLGRPFYAFRALLGLRTSWLSREILAFTIFAGTAAAYVGVSLIPQVIDIQISPQTVSGLGLLAAFAGIAAVFTSVMIYVDTRRPCWTFPTTSAKFALTALILGLPVALLLLLVGALNTSEFNIAFAMQHYGRTLCEALLWVVAAKGTLELSAFLHLRSRQHTPQKRHAMLLTGELSRITLRRFIFAFVGGVVIPASLLAVRDPTSYQPAIVFAATMLMLAMLAIGELHERYLFFAASVAARMPGGPTA